MDATTKNMKLAESCNCFSECTHFKYYLIEYKCLYFNKDYQKKFHENLKKKLLIHTNFLTMISKSLFYCCGKVFTHMNT